MKRHFPALDGIRGVAAICVMLMHFTLAQETTLFASAMAAVDLFFCLSGFVIAHSYGAKLDAGMGFGAFFTLRIVRLYPLYALGSLLGLGAYVALGDAPAHPLSLVELGRAALGVPDIGFDWRLVHGRADIHQ